MAPAMRPRLLPKVPFRFCVHADGDRHWMQLEGGTAELMPDAVRIIDANPYSAAMSEGTGVTVASV